MDIIAHHSTADWDIGRYPPGSYTWELKDDEFHSGPTSFGNKSGTNGVVLLALPAAADIVQGRLRCWLYHPSGYWPILAFRNQSPLGSVTWVNTYALYVGLAGELRLYQLVDGAPGLVYNPDFTPPNNEWYAIRVTWENEPTEDWPEGMNVHLEAQVAGEWQDLGVKFVARGLWRTTGTNRVGFRPLYLQQRYDDTAIWKKD